MLTTFGTSDELRRALDAGAVGAFVKDSAHGQLIGAIRHAAAGERTISPEIERQLKASEQEPELTPRQTEILAYVAKGLNNREIAPNPPASRLAAIRASARGLLGLKPAACASCSRDCRRPRRSRPRLRDRNCSHARSCHSFFTADSSACDIVRFRKLVIMVVHTPVFVISSRLNESLVIGIRRLDAKRNAVLDDGLTDEHHDCRRHVHSKPTEERLGFSLDTIIYAKVDLRHI